MPEPIESPISSNFVFIPLVESSRAFDAVTVPSVVSLIILFCCACFTRSDVIFVSTSTCSCGDVSGVPVILFLILFIL